MEIQVAMPDVGFSGDTPMSISHWFVGRGEEMLEGDRLVEILAGSVTFDIPAPVTGKLVEVRFVEEDRVTTGDVLALVEPIDENE